MDRSKMRAALGKVLVTAGAVGAIGIGARVFHTHVSASAATLGGGVASAPGRAGVQRRWAMTLEARMKQSGQGGSRETAIHLSGDWVTTVSGESPAGIDVACELENAHAEGTGFGSVSKDEVEQLERRLARRIWITYQADGAATRAHFPRDMSDDVRNFLELIATEAQLVRPAARSPQWTATERDAAGSYFASYEALGPGAILKRKTQYLKADGAGGPAGIIGVRVDSSETRFALDSAGLVNDLDGHEATHVAANLGGLEMEIEVRLHLGQAQSGRAPELAGSLDRARGDVDSQPIITQRASDDVMQRRRDERLIAGVELPQVLARLLDAAHAGATDSDAAAKLEAMLRTRPSDIAPAVVFARGAGKDASTSVLQALGAAGTAPAQEALCGLAGSDAPVPLRTAALTALVRTKRATPATVATLLRLLDASEPEVRRQALYMTGTAGQSVHATDPAATARIEAELLARQARCARADCVDVLVALGNLATPGILPSVQRSLADPNPGVRAAAVRALRNVDEPSVDRLVSATMTGDSEPSVRAAAVFTATFRPVLGLAEALARTVRADPIDYVRSSAIEAAANHLDQSPLLAAAVADAAEKDPKPGVQRLARQVLGGAAPSPDRVPQPSLRSNGP